MDLASEELDAIEASVRFVDAETWMTVVSLAERIMKDPATRTGTWLRKLWLFSTVRRRVT